MNKKAVVYGAGSIGRGFIGQLFSESGYEVVFIDIDDEIVRLINEKKKYRIVFVSNKEEKIIYVKNIKAVNGKEHEKIKKEISEADIIATAVGVDIIPYIIPIIAEGVERRWNNDNQKLLNILICENMINSDDYFKELFKQQFNDKDSRKIDETLGFIKTSVGRMVPNSVHGDKNILEIYTEEYNNLPVDKKGFKGDIPNIKYMNPSTPFEYHMYRKLFLHNMGHAVAAYLGNLKGYEYIWEVMEDEEIFEIIKSAMNEVSCSLAEEYDMDYFEIRRYSRELLSRFSNKKLGDKISRVGRDLKRKLSADDRLMGAIKLCRRNGVEPVNIIKGIVAALFFEDPIKSISSEYNIDVILKKVCKIEENSWEWNKIKKYYYKYKINQNTSNSKVLNFKFVNDKPVN